MPILYSIAEYDRLYRPYDKSGREMQRPGWVKLPAKPKGDGLQALLREKRGLEVFAVWCLLLEKTTAEKPENRGKLVNHKDEPASISQIAASISLSKKQKLVEYALKLLVSMGWINADTMSSECPHNVHNISSHMLDIDCFVLIIE